MRAGKSPRNLAECGLQHLIIATPQYGHLNSQGDLPGAIWHRNRAVKDRSQVRSPLNDKETKRDDTSRKFMAQKKTSQFKGVRRDTERNTAHLGYR
jgi:hypothetical protein